MQKGRVPKEKIDDIDDQMRKKSMSDNGLLGHSGNHMQEIVSQL